MLVNVFLGTPGRHWPSRNTGTKRTTRFDGKIKINGSLQIRCSFSSRCWYTEFLQTALSAWRTSTRSSESSIICVSFIANVPLLSRAWKALWAPLASLGPAVIRYVPHLSSHLPSFMWLLSVFFLAVIEWSSVFFLTIRDPRVTKEAEGRWCVALFWWILVCLYCEHRIGYLVWRRHSTQPPLPSALFFSFPIVFRCLLLHSRWHLAAVEILSVW